MKNKLPRYSVCPGTLLLLGIAPKTACMHLLNTTESYTNKSLLQLINKNLLENIYFYSMFQNKSYKGIHNSDN